MHGTSSYSHNRGLSAAAERQMRNWALDLQTRQQVSEEHKLTQVPQLIHPYLFISRETGVDAGELAKAIAATCGWKSFDRELLDYLAEKDHLSRLALEFVDERSVSWFHEMFGKWLDEQLVSQAEYISRLGKAVLLATQHESTVFVGRGIQFMLPRDQGMAVRFIAPQKQRVQRIMEMRHCGEREAKHFVEETDSERAQFVQRYFHHDIADPHLYDLVINLGRVPREEAIELVAHQVKRFEQRTVLESSGRASAERQFQRLDQSPRAPR